MPQPLRIFISSPSDVAPERLRAALVIEKLQKDYARFFSVSSVLWETEPMVATGHFQDVIDLPSSCDIVVLILWSRLGVKLPARTERRAYEGIDGRTPVTGTEWEFEEALAAAKQHNSPALLAYHKTAEPVVSLKDSAKKAAAEEQWRMMEAFWRRHFYDAGEFITAHAEFETLDAFEAKLEADLRRLIEGMIARLQASSDVAPMLRYLKGNPFRGLESFRFEDAAVFFGRAQAIKLAVEALVRNGEAGRAFLMVLGASGAGKSSLAQAGVLPSLMRHGVVSGARLWRWAVMHPAGHPDGPFAALAEALTAPGALPEILAGGQDVAALARHLAAAAEDPVYPFATALNRLEETGRAANKLLTYETARLVIVVDQLEELFTAPGTPAASHAPFVRCLARLAACGRVFVVATMRADYWHRTIEIPELAQLAADRGRIDLLPATQSEITEMIRRPAQAAGLSFEVDSNTEIGLDTALSEEAANAPGILPLMSFLLDALYVRDVEQFNRTTLTYESMRALGGLNGALQRRADVVFEGVSPQGQGAFPAVFSALVRVGIDESEEKVAQRRASRAALETVPGAGELIDAFVAARLFVADVYHGANAREGGAIIGVTHEALLRAWPRAADWIRDNATALRTRARIAAAEALWRHEGRPAAGLLKGNALSEASALRAGGQVTMTAEASAFIGASEVRATSQRKGRRLRVAAAAAVVLAAAGAGAWYWDGYVDTKVAWRGLNFIHRWGIPEPYGPQLSEEQVRHRQESVRVYRRGRYGPVVAFETRNGHGFCTQNSNLSSYFGKLKQGGFSSAQDCRDDVTIEAGRAVKEVDTDRNGNILWTFLYSNTDPVHPTGAYYTPRGTFLPMEGSGASRMDVVRFADGPQAGLDKRMRFLSDTGQPRPHHEGYYGFAYRYDDRDRPVLIQFLGADGQPAMRRDGYAAVRTAFDDDGNIKRQVYEDLEGRKAVSTALGASAVDFEYRDGNLVKFTLLDDQDRVIRGADSWASTRFAYNEHGDRIETAYFDSFGNPAMANAGFAKLTVSYDGEGRMTEIAYFDAAGKPVAFGGAPKRTFTYDAKGNQDSVTYRDAQDRPMKVADGFAGERQTFDDQGFAVSWSYSDETGQPVAMSGSSVAKIVARRDDYGNLVSRRFLDTKGKPTRDKTGAAEMRFTYDDRGNVTSRSHFDEAGRPVNTSEGFASFKKVYDEHGFLVKESYFGVDGRPTNASGGYADITATNDENGRQIRAVYVDANNRPLDTKLGCAIFDKDYDRLGHTTKSTCRDGDGKPSRRTVGYSVETAKYDFYGRLLEAAYFDEAGKPFFTKEGYSVVKLGYDDPGNFVDIQYAYDPNGPKKCGHIHASFVNGKRERPRCMDPKT